MVTLLSNFDLRTLIPSGSGGNWATARLERGKSPQQTEVINSEGRIFSCCGKKKPTIKTTIFKIQKCSRVVQWRKGSEVRQREEVGKKIEAREHKRYAFTSLINPSFLETSWPAFTLRNDRQIKPASFIKENPPRQAAKKECRFNLARPAGTTTSMTTSPVPSGSVPG